MNVDELMDQICELAEMREAIQRLYMIATVAGKHEEALPYRLRLSKFIIRQEVEVEKQLEEKGVKL